MSHGGGGSEKSPKNVTYYLNGPLVFQTLFQGEGVLMTNCALDIKAKNSAQGVLRLNGKLAIKVKFSQEGLIRLN